MGAQKILAAKPAEKLNAKPAEKPAEKPTEKPVAKPAEKPAEKPTEKPAAKPAKPTTCKGALKLVDTSDKLCKLSKWSCKKKRNNAPTPVKKVNTANWFKRTLGNNKCRSWLYKIFFYDQRRIPRATWDRRVKAYLSNSKMIEMQVF